MNPYINLDQPLSKVVDEVSSQPLTAATQMLAMKAQLERLTHTTHSGPSFQPPPYPKE